MCVCGAHQHTETMNVVRLLLALIAILFVLFVRFVTLVIPSIAGYYLFYFFPSFQVDDTEVISFLLSTEIIPLCLRTMEMGSELSKTVSAQIL